MSQLAHLLKIFERDDVAEVVLQSDKPATAKVGNEYRGLTKTPMSTEQIESLIGGTELEELIPERDGVSEPREIDLLGMPYVGRGARRGRALQIRIEKPQIEIVPQASPSSVRPPGPRKMSSRSMAAIRVPSGARTLTQILREARERGATDAHVVAGRPALVRVAGELLPDGDPIAVPKVESMLLELLTEAQTNLLDERGYVDLASAPEGAGRLRVNISRQRSGLKGSFRLVMDPTPTLDSLGLPKELSKVTTYHQGLVVIAGPSGHGKTTTLAAIVDSINATRPHHILTVEEPIEFVHERKKAVVSQREVGPHTNSFATALKASLREDPDVIVIGELRDRETVEIAMTAAETGHLVIATMSTPSAAKTIDRLIDLFPPEDQQQVRATLAGALKFIVAQRLLPSNEGGVVAVVELLSNSAALASMIRDNKLFQLPNLQQRGRAFGIIRFDDSLLDHLRAGRITEELALRFAENKKEMEVQIKGGQQPAAPPPPAPGPGAAASAAQQAQKLGEAASRLGRGLFGKKE